MVVGRKSWMQDGPLKVTEGVARIRPEIWCRGKVDLLGKSVHVSSFKVHVKHGRDVPLEPGRRTYLSEAGGLVRFVKQDVIDPFFGFETQNRVAVE
jgi:hypothetical protein